MRRSLLFISALILLFAARGKGLAETAAAVVAPVSLTATAISSGSITLGWEDNNTTETGYEIQRKLGLCSSANSWADIKTTAADITSYADTGLAAATQYSYRVRAIESASASPYSACATAKTGIAGTPASPAGVKAVSASSNDVDITWTHSGADVTGFWIYRKTGQTTVTLTGTTAAARSYRDTTASGNNASVSFTYFVKAENNSGFSPASNSAAVPFSPANLTASKTSQVVGLSWQDRSANETGFQVYRMKGGCSSGGTWKLIATTQANATAYNDANSSGVVSYRVRSMVMSSAMPRAYGYSGYSNCVEIGEPEAPTGLSAASQSASAVKITWTHPGVYLTGFKVFRKTGAGAWALLSTTAATVMNYTDSTATGNTASKSYSYQVKAVNATGDSPASRTAVVPFQPSSLAVSKTGLSVKLQWQDNSANETDFRIMRKAGTCAASGTWAEIGTSAADMAAYTDTDASGPVAYKVRAAAVSAYQPYATGYSGYSNCIEIFAGSAVQLPETGQNACYDAIGSIISCTGTGQDGELKKGVAWPSPRFVAGTGAAADCVTDELTGLMWPKNAALAGAAKTWNGALNYANNLTHCGYSDWRLPNRKELFSLIDRSLYNPALPSDHLFTNVNMVTNYWSSTNNPVYTDEAWTVYMWSGILDSFKKTASYYVWPVRAAEGAPSVIDLPDTGQISCYNTTGTTVACAGTGQDGEMRKGIAWPSPRFVSGAGTESGCMQDKLTGLMWPKDGNPAGAAKTWQDALAYANGLILCGHADWRLPNVNEIESLINAEEPDTSAWLMTKGFSNVQSCYFSSSTYADYKDLAWRLDMWLGIVDYSFKSGTCYAWPVRGGQ